MTTSRHVVLGLAPPRAAWFGGVARLATSGGLPVEFVKCVSVAELRARLGSGRLWSAALVDAAVAGLDRDLIGAAAAHGVPVLVVGERPGRDWAGLGAAAVLPVGFGRDDLLDALRRHARVVRPAEAVPVVALGDDPDGDELDGPGPGALVAVCGDPGAGASTLAIALAQGLAAGRPGEVLLADLALGADQALLHGVGDVVPGLPELVEAHRLGIPSAERVLELLFGIDERGYRLLLGLRRHRDWATLRPRAFAAGLASLRRTHEAVVADVDGDVEGEAETGSAEVEERNLLARTVATAADVVLVVGGPTLKGLHGLVRTAQDLLAFGVPPERLLPVVNRAPRPPRLRRELTGAVAELLGGRIAAVVLVPEHPRLEWALRDRLPLPAAVVRPVAAASRAVLDRAGPRTMEGPVAERVVAGTLGHWAEGGLAGA